MIENKENNNNILSVTEKGKNSNHLSEMFKDWFLDYASYVILERSVPYLLDGLKPVQRRILHAMKLLDDGRYNKVANIIGYTIQFHPHGDTSIGDALVQLGQKDLLIDTHGNWGNTFTGDTAAAFRYIEARLSKFALEVLFNVKTTKWQLSYDGRNKEPVGLPSKFPLLLAQGAEGIAVGLACKILPHNFNEIIDAAINYLQKKDFTLYPDFPTGGMIDINRYNDGLRGEQVKVRAKIEKLNNKTIVIREIPFGKTINSIIESIIKANNKGKIKIRKIDDNTSSKVEIVIHLPAKVSSDKTIDALYAFTDCEISISPNACVIYNDKPAFLGIKEILRITIDNTVSLLQNELEINHSELLEKLHFTKLEKIFIEKKIYRKIEPCETTDEIIAEVKKGLAPYVKEFTRNITLQDIEKLHDIKIKHISKYDLNIVDKNILKLKNEIEEISSHIANIIPYTIKYYKTLKKKYGRNNTRKSTIRNFEQIEATKVVIANKKLYVNKKEGFIGTGLRHDEYVCDCSDIDDIIIFKTDGTYRITKVDEKVFVGKKILHLAVFKKNDKRTTYNVVYRDGISGYAFIKRFFVKRIQKDKEYHITQGKPNSRILYFSANPNGEAEIIRILHKITPRLRKPVIYYNFADLSIKNRKSIGNILTKKSVAKIALKEAGTSTLGGRKLWFDMDVKRLNVDARGKYLGEFSGNDKILVLTSNGKFRITNFDISNHFEEDIISIQKFKPDIIWTVVYFNAKFKQYYLKRFYIDNFYYNLTSFIGNNLKSTLMHITAAKNPVYRLYLDDKNSPKEPENTVANEFIGVKSYKTKGKRLTNLKVRKIDDITITKEHTNQLENLKSIIPQDEEKNQQMSLDRKSTRLNSSH